MIKKTYFNKIQSDYIFSYIISFFNLSDIRSLFPLSKRFLNILTKDNNKIIRDIQKKIFSQELNFLPNLNHAYNYNTYSFPLNKAPILNSIKAQNFLISSSNQFDDGFFIHNLTNNILCQIIIFDKKNYSYVKCMLYIEEKKIILIGSNNGFIVGYYLSDDNKDNNSKNIVNYFWEYKTGLNKEIKNIIYYNHDNNILILSLDSNEEINLNFIRIFCIQNNINIDNKDEIYNKKTIRYMKRKIKKNCFIYNIKYFSEENNSNNYKGFICLALNQGNDYYKEKNTILKKDKIINNELGMLNVTQIKYNINDIENNYEIIIKKGTYDELNIDYYLKGHNSYISDFIFLKNYKNKNYILSIEYLSPYLFIWDIELKSKINQILLPHTDSILCLLNIDNKYLATSGRDRKIYIYNMEEILSSSNNIAINNQEIKSNHKSDIFKLNFYSNKINNSVISSSFDKSIKIFEFKDYNFKKITKIILSGHSAPINCVKYDTLRKRIITIDIDNVINVWEYKELYGFFKIIKSIEIINIKGKKEFFDDAILLYDDLNSLIKIDRTNTIKIFSLVKEEFIYEYCDKNINNDGFLKILDFCNFRDFVCYTSKNVIKVYNYKIKKNFYEINYIKDINIDEKIIEEKPKMTCFEMISWKYKIIGIGFNNKKINVIIFDNKIKYKQYIIDINSYINDNNINKDIIQIKSIEIPDKKIVNIKFFLYIIFPINNTFYLFSLLYDNIELKSNLIYKIIFKDDINIFEILNKNLLICSFSNNFKNGLIHLPDYIQEKNKDFEIKNNKDINIDMIEISEEYFNKIIYTNNRKGIFFISNNSIKYIEFN